MDDLPQGLQLALIRELQGKVNEERAQAAIEQIETIKALGARKMMDGLGQLRLSVHPTFYHAIGQKYGYGCWSDKAFVADIWRMHPEFRVPTVLPPRVLGGIGERTTKFKKTY